MSTPTKLLLTVWGKTRHGGIWDDNTIIEAIKRHCPECRIIDIPSGYVVRNRKTNEVESKPVLVEFESKAAIKRHRRAEGYSRYMYGWLPYGDKDGIRRSSIHCADYELDG